MKVATAIRWLLTLAMIWALVLPETGPWTCLVLTLIAAETEYQHGRRMGYWP